MIDELNKRAEVPTWLADEQWALEAYGPAARAEKGSRPTADASSYSTEHSGAAEPAPSSDNVAAAQFAQWMKDKNQQIEFLRGELREKNEQLKEKVALEKERNELEKRREERDKETNQIMRDLGAIIGELKGQGLLNAPAAQGGAVEAARPASRETPPPVPDAEVVTEVAAKKTEGAAKAKPASKKRSPKKAAARKSARKKQPAPSPLDVHLPTLSRIGRRLLGK